MYLQRFSWAPALVAALVLVPAFVFASQASLPHTFTNGAIADANEVNANFNALAAAINDNDMRIRSLGGGEINHYVPIDTQSAQAGGQALHTLLGTLTPGVPAKVQLGAGLYDMGSTTLVVPDAVTLCGAGKRATKIRSTAEIAIRMNARSTLAALTLEARPTSGGAGVLVQDMIVAARLCEVEIGVGGTGTVTVSGIRIKDAGVTMRGSEIFSFGDGAGVARGIYVEPTTPGFQGGVGALVRESSLSVGGASVIEGVRADDGAVELFDSTVGSNGIGIAVADSGGNFATSVTLQNCRLLAIGNATTTSGAAYCHIATTRIQGTTTGNTTLVHCFDNAFNALP